MSPLIMTPLRTLKEAFDAIPAPRVRGWPAGRHPGLPASMVARQSGSCQPGPKSTAINSSNRISCDGRVNPIMSHTAAASSASIFRLKTCSITPTTRCPSRYSVYTSWITVTRRPSYGDDCSQISFTQIRIRTATRNEIRVNMKGSLKLGLRPFFQNK